MVASRPQSAVQLLRRLGPAAGIPLLLPAVAAAAPVWAVSSLVRHLSALRLLEPPATSQNLIDFDPVLGARPRPRLDTYGRGEDVFHLTTDDEGWRGGLPLEQADAVVVGDSFAFGYGVDDADHFTNRVQGHRVKAVASPAYSMVHGILAMQQLAPRLRARHLVWLIYTGNDLVDNLHLDIGHYRMPFVRSGDDGAWEIATDHVSSEPWVFGSGPRDNDRGYADLSTPSPYSDRVFSAADFLIGEAAKLATDLGVSLTVVTVPITTAVKDPDRLRAAATEPDRVDLSQPDRRLASSCEARSLPFVPLAPRLRPKHYWHDDMHWNPAGHRAFAAVLERILNGGADVDQVTAVSA